MGTKTVIKQLKGKLGPGPGGYSVDKPKNENLSFSMGGKLEDLEFKAKLYVPGPGSHNPSPERNAPQTKFGSDVRKTFKSNVISPGPGAY